jgi:hypothetical protein
MEAVKAQKNRYHLVCPRLPLAVYREVAAHIRQIAGIDTGLIPYSVGKNDQANHQQFDYGQSQVKGLWLEYAQNLEAKNKQRLNEILEYYAQRYSPWESR